MADAAQGLSAPASDPNRCLLLTGARGSGKTVLLAQLAKAAQDGGWAVAEATCSDRLLGESYEQAAHAAGALGASVVDLRVEGGSWRVRVQPVLEGLNASGSGLLLVVDGIYPNCAALAEVVDGVSHFLREGRAVALYAAGLPHHVDALLADPQMAFLEGARRLKLDRMDQADIALCLKRTIQNAGRSIGPNALELAAQVCGGNAYMMQLVGYEMWRQHPEHSRISRDDAVAGINAAGTFMIDTLFTPTLRALSDKDKRFLKAMAQDEGPASMADVANRLNVSTGYARMYKKRLMDHGLIFSPSRGYVDVVMPLLGAYLRSDDCPF